MDSNAFLLSFGMKPGDFDRDEGPIESDDGFFHEAWGPGNRQGAGGNLAILASSIQRYRHLINSIGIVDASAIYAFA